MFNSRYGNLLTIILVMVIVLIIGLVGWFAYDMYKQYSTNNKAETAVEDFEKNLKKKVSDSEVEGNYQLDIGNTVTSTSFSGNKKTYLEKYEIKGIIEIPKTKIKYPILSKVTPRSLELAVAVLYGPGLNEVGNTIIFGHNYRNDMFFSNNDKLSNGDEIYITDQSGNKVTYTIYKIYQTDEYDTDYMLRDTDNAREISLSTCTDDSKERIVIWAKEKKKSTDNTSEEDGESEEEYDEQDESSENEIENENE